jgi:hypothetical protein
LAVQWLNEALCFVSSSVVAESLRLRNRQLLVAAKRYLQPSRKLISLGWDTLEVHSNEGYNGAKWALKDYANIGGFLN